jgi:hypothetical protein
MKKLRLDTFQRGAVMDLFDEELRDVRKINIEFSIMPDKTRSTAETSIKVTSKIAGIKPQNSFLFFDHQEIGTGIEAFEDDPGPELPFIVNKAGGE